MRVLGCISPTVFTHSIVILHATFHIINFLSLAHVRRGSAIAKIVGTNARNNSKFDSTVNMWVFEETVNGRKLTEIINTDHDNVKYLPGHKLPENVVRDLHLTLDHIMCYIYKYK